MSQYDKGTDASSVPGRICGLLTARGRSAEWEKAFEHISMHFKNDPTKQSHTRFRRKYCEEHAIKELIKRACTAPSSVKSIKLTIAGMPIGRDGVKIVRTFAEPIGDGPDLMCLIVIADSQGALMTAYPGTKEDL
jgi:hypothetical protein